MTDTKRVLISVATGAVCTLAGLLVEIIGGLIAWPLFVFPLGPIFAAVAGGCTALFIRRSTPWPASSSAGAIGAFVAAFFCMICMDVYEPGSLDWALRGGFYGAVWGLPFGVLLGPMGLLRFKRGTGGKTPGA